MRASWLFAASSVTRNAGFTVANLWWEPGSSLCPAAHQVFILHMASNKRVATEKQPLSGEMPDSSVKIGHIWEGGLGSALSCARMENKDIIL